MALEGRIGDRMSYLEGYNGMIDDDNTVTLAARAVLVSDDPSTVTSIVSTTVAASTVMATVASVVDELSSTSSCTSETEAPSTTATIFPVVNSTTATDNSIMSS